MKFEKVWTFGGSKKSECMDDYVDYYLREDHKIKIECCHGFSNFNNRWYEVYSVSGEYNKLEKYLNSFDTLKEAKEYALTI